MDSRIIAVLFLLCLALAGCTGQYPGYVPTGNSTADGNAVFSKLMENIDANRVSDYKVQADANVSVSMDGVPLGNISVISWANISGRDGHALFYATLSMPNGTGTLPSAYSREYYMSDGRIFGETDGTWTERSLPPGFPDAFDSQTEIAVSSIDPASLQTVGEEDVEGVPCYVLQGPWNPGQEIAFASSMAGSSARYALPNESEYQPIEGNVTLWISKDRYALMKHEREAGVIIGNRTRIDASETMTYQDRNVTNAIDLPESVIGQSGNIHPA